MRPMAPREPAIPPDLAELDKRLWEFKVERGLAHAADAIAAGFMLGATEQVREPAQYILSLGKSTPLATMRLAQRVLHESRSEGPIQTASSSGPLDGVHRMVSAAKASLAIEPRNALLWVDLALLYTRLGQHVKSERAMRVALALAPVNRFVVRSAARLLLHQNRPDEAHDLLRRTPSVQRDPWILAAEIAVADAADRESANMKAARTLLESGRFHPHDISELAGVLGTEELREGVRRKARKLFEMSIDNPTENAVAQAVVADHSGLGLGVPERLVSETPRSFEARARQQFVHGHWKDALESAIAWQEDQPFSSRPAMFGSYIAGTTLFDFSTGIQIARLGLAANPSDFIMLNNLAYALAQSDKPADAQKVLSRVAVAALSPSERIVWLATSGLVAFRASDSQLGRKLYSTAAQEAREGNDERKLALALANQALEELRVQSTQARSVAGEALRAIDLGKFPDLEPLRKKIVRTAETLPEPKAPRS